ncbi:MAG TPA: ABC transporter permease [Blastocatellia bacterium]|nr:ABC transporter permease [Blastocatellia bacterium]
MLNRLKLRLRALFFKSKMEVELDEEVRFHLEREIEENIARGMSPEEARYAALRSFGGIERVKEESRDERGIRLLDEVRQDLRYGVRMLLKSPNYALIAVISLALGIGANTAIFSVVNTLLLKALPYHDPDRIVLVWGADNQSAAAARSQVSATDVADWRRQNSVFAEITTYGNWSATLLSGNEPERINGIQVGDGYFSALQGKPLLGRVFLPEEQEDGKDFVIVLGHGLWQRRFGGDPQIIGRQVNLSGRPYTIVGVMPPDFQSLPISLVEPRGEFYRPVAEKYDEAERSSRHLRAIARLNPSVTLRQAQAEMSVIAHRLERQHPQDNTNYSVRLTTLTEDTVGGLRQTLLLLLGAVLFVLLIACANVSNLLLARAAARQKELSIRAALGAGRLRLLRQLLTESVLLSLTGGALGLLLARWGTSLIESLGAQVTPLLSGVKLDARVLTFTLMISLLTGVVFGLAPALHVSRPDLNETLKDAGHSAGAGAHGSRLRGALVVAEMALALVLLICAGLLIQSVLRLRAVNPGFNPSNLLTMNVALPSAKYPKPQQRVEFHNRLVERLVVLPGVNAAGFTSVLPFSSNFDGRGLAVEDQPKPPGAEISVDLYIITPDYLRTMAIPLRTGRPLTERDTEETPKVALINETMARALWPKQDPLGKRIKFPGSERNPQPWRSIVGVVADVAQYALDRQPPMQIYLADAQYPASFMTLVVRTASDPAGFASAVRNEVRALDKEQAVFGVAALEELIGASIALRRFLMLLLLSFAAVALSMAAVGIYGVISYAVTQRTREIGIRMALGAQASDVLRLVVGQGLRLVLSGVVIGLVVALGLTRLIKTMLFGVSARDPLTFIVISMLLTVVALLACWIPARRATKVDPLLALRRQ